MQICQLAYLQLFVARELAVALPRPWERYLPAFQTKDTSPSMVQRDFLRIIGTIEPKPAFPKRRGKSPGASQRGKTNAKGAAESHPKRQKTGQICRISHRIDTELCRFCALIGSAIRCVCPQIGNCLIFCSFYKVKFWRLTDFFQSPIHMEQAGVDKAVLIQHQGNTDNSYHVECLQSYPGRFAAAMIVEKTDTGKKIRYWAEQGIVGIRLSADSRVAAADALAQWRTAAALNLVVSAPCSPSTLLSKDFAEVIKTFPNLQIVIEHLGGIRQEAEPPYDEFKRVLALAKHANLTIKLPGFGEFCKLPHPFEHVPPFARMVGRSF